LSSTLYTLTTRFDTYLKFGEGVVIQVSAPATTPSAGILQGYVMVLAYCFNNTVVWVGSGLKPVAFMWMAVPPIKLPAMEETAESETVDIQSMLMAFTLKIMNNNTISFTLLLNGWVCFIF
jgi:hypothetical protein